MDWLTSTEKTLNNMGHFYTLHTCLHKILVYQYLYTLILLINTSTVLTRFLQQFDSAVTTLNNIAKLTETIIGTVENFQVAYKLCCLLHNRNGIEYLLDNCEEIIERMCENLQILFEYRDQVIVCALFRNQYWSPGTILYEKTRNVG